MLIPLLPRIIPTLYGPSNKNDSSEKDENENKVFP